jgi:hypothetical protein
MQKPDMTVAEGRGSTVADLSNDLAALPISRQPASFSAVTFRRRHSSSW